jgi:hypothetical protein
MWVVALAIVVAGYWISTSFDDFNVQAERLNDNFDRLIWALEDQEDE